jgi:Leucine-rich repeat (LRR) protein
MNILFAILVYFYYFVRLQNLNTVAGLGLRGNGITIPPKDALASLQSLQELNLDENNITVVGKDAFGRSRVLSKLTMSKNKVLYKY